MNHRTKQSVTCLVVYCLTFAFSANAGSPKDADQICGQGRHWVKSHFRRSYIRTDGRRFKATRVKAHCSDNPPGFAFWNPKLKETSPKNWPLNSERSKKWKEEERERVLEALGYLPKQMSEEPVQSISRMERSVSYPNSASGDRDGNIILYDNAFDDDKNLGQILAHEILHRDYERLSAEDKESYSFAAGWVNISANPVTPEFVIARKGLVAPDSANSIEEDYCNNTEAFLFNPSKLKEVSPSSYNWISKHFGATFKLGKGSPQ